MTQDQTTRPNPIDVSLATDENDRMARETARDAYRAAIALIDQGRPNWSRFGVQHVSGKITLTVEFQP